MTTERAPVQYSPSVERQEPDEQQTTDELVAALRSISETTFADYRHAVRSVHAKGHGIIRGTLEILPELPDNLAQGLFANAGTYDVAMRFSTTPGDIVDDKISTPRGLAVKIMNVEGERLPGSEESSTQDFLMVNGPAFNAPSAKAFLKNLQLLAKTTDKAEGLKKVLSAALRGAEAIAEAFGTQSATLKALGGHPLTSPLGETYFTQTPMRYGNFIAKLSLAPSSPGLLAMTGAPVDLDGKPFGLRESISDFFSTQGGTWALRVQLCTDLEKMPIEDSSVAWDETDSPYLPVATLNVRPQASWVNGHSEEIEDSLSFSPWHGISAHKPLGSIMRVRKSAYEMSASFRSSHNKCPVREFRDIEAIN